MRNRITAFGLAVRTVLLSALLVARIGIR